MLKVMGSLVLSAGMLMSGMAMAADQNTVMSVERSAFGKPPFKREFREVTDIAAADTVAIENVETVEVRTVAMGANRKAPYRRTTVEVPVTDIAAMDIVDEPEGKRFNPARKPPYNRHH